MAPGDRSFLSRASSLWMLQSSPSDSYSMQLACSIGASAASDAVHSTGRDQHRCVDYEHRHSDRHGKTRLRLLGIRRNDGNASSRHHRFAVDYDDVDSGNAKQRRWRPFDDAFRRYSNLKWPRDVHCLQSGKGSTGALLGCRGNWNLWTSLSTVNIPTDNLNNAVGEVAFSAFSRVQDDPIRLKSYFLKGYSLVQE